MRYIPEIGLYGFAFTGSIIALYIEKKPKTPQTRKLAQIVLGCCYTALCFAAVACVKGPQFGQ